MSLENSYENADLVREGVKKGAALAIRHLKTVSENPEFTDTGTLLQTLKYIIDHIVDINEMSGAEIDGMNKVIAYIRKYTEIGFSPKYLAPQVEAAFEQDDTYLKLAGKPATEDAINVRFDLIEKLALEFHPASRAMKELDPLEQERRMLIYSEEITVAIQMLDPQSLLALEMIARAEGINI
ncbi:hypothetical protein KJ835_04075 [Patescibacteria group bacterium]|nr:hypothetical protein [Patescibacteria group bacterium]MBU1953463.1 hypothetical protein [Patescibacteria group bacterium]